mmetsp:Transcript_1952/g.3109  ORF Transcript_1952/g.3109 Transcript_1952/m.3109 type:complete len:291 (-) Transcript_1952:154-1026(-)
MIAPLTSTALRAYDALAQSHPLAATSLISCATYASAELFRQICLPAPTPTYATSLPSVVTVNEHRQNKPLLNLRAGPRGILLMGLVGALIHAPWITFWFNLLESIRPGKHISDICTKIILDQSIGCPIYFLMLSFTTNILFFEIESFFCDQRRGQRKFIQNTKKVTDGMWNAVKLSWTAWPLLHAINYSCVPLKRRRLVIQAGGLAWAIFLCCLTASKGVKEGDNKAAAGTVELLESTNIQGFSYDGDETAAADMVAFPAMAAAKGGNSGTASRRLFGNVRSIRKRRSIE